MKRDDLLASLAKAMMTAPQVAPLLSDRARIVMRFEAIKAQILTREQAEAKLARAIAAVEKKYLDLLREKDGVIYPDFWRDYERDMREAVSSILRQQIEGVLTIDNDYVQLVDVADANAKIDSAITAAVAAVVMGISRNSQTLYAELLAQGVAGAELVERIALRFSSGHAEQIAVTELSKSENIFSEILADDLNALGLPTQQRWLTFEDERVCPICEPADHKLRDEPINTARGGWNGQTWGQRFGATKKPHPHCRCQISVEVIGWKPQV